MTSSSKCPTRAKSEETVVSSTERKARKRAGIKFTKAPKEGTPYGLRRQVMDRRWHLLNAARRRGDVSRREFRKAGRKIDKGLDWVEKKP
jgi:hypothetical protein